MGMEFIDMDSISIGSGRVVVEEEKWRDVSTGTSTRISSRGR